MNQTQPLCQQIDRDTVARVIQEFYHCVLAEPGLADYFAPIENWPAHESHVTDFWWGLMGGRVERPRPNAMEAAHRGLHFSPGELALWLALFEQTLQQQLPADIAGQWITLAQQISQMMARRGMLTHG